MTRHPHRLLGALALALALVACGETPAPDAPSAAAAPATRPATIPDDFPITSGMTSEQLDDVTITREGPGLRELTFCGSSPLAGASPVDHLVGTTSESGTARRTREVLLLADDAAATALVDGLVAALEDCPADEIGDGSVLGLQWFDHPDKAPDLVPGGEDLVAVRAVQQQDFTLGAPAEVIQVARSGSAVLVAWSRGDWAGAGRLTRAVDDESDRLHETAAALGGLSPTAPPAAGADHVPDGFPLGVDMVSDGGDFQVTGPSRDGEGVGTVEVCGHVVWPPGPVTDRLATVARGPEYGDARELLVLLDPYSAVRTVAEVRDLLAQPCPLRTPVVWTGHEADTGFDSVTFSISQERGLGLSILQLTRVGRAVLLVQRAGEGTLDGVEEQVAQVTSLTRRIAPEMCAFTAAEC